MKFSGTIEDIDISVEVFEDLNYSPFSQFNIVTGEDIEDIETGLIKYYNLVVISTKGEEVSKHYYPGILLSADESDLEEDLEDLLSESSIVEEVSKHWELRSDENGPGWKE